MTFRHTPTQSTLLLFLYANSDWENLSTALLQSLDALSRTTYIQISPSSQAELNEFIGVLLFLLTRPDYDIPEAKQEAFIHHNPSIGNAVAISSFKTTDAHLALLATQQHNLVKVLTLYNARCTTVLERKSFFDANPRLTSVWYTAFFGIYHSCLVNEQAWSHLRRHVLELDPRFIPIHQYHHMFYSVSYADPERDRAFKHHINAALQHTLRDVEVRNTPNPKRIAVITNRWFPAHSVYRNQATWLAALRPDYNLVLFHLGPVRADADVSLFSEVHEVILQGTDLNLGALTENNFGMAYYPEVGMAMESIILSNLRVAPIQVASYGHSVSTYGSQIDYWVGGADVELRDSLKTKYSERVILVPGLGIGNVKPTYEPTGRPPVEDRIIVNCSWYPQKVSWPLVQMVQKIAERVGWVGLPHERPDRPVLFRLFSGGGLLEINHYLPFVRTIQEALGDQVEVMPGLGYQDYMRCMEEGALSLDAFHYGGCNTVVDSLHIRRPILTLEGNHWYNRIGGGILRKAGFPDMVVQNEWEFVRHAVKLIANREYREEVSARLREADIDGRLYDLPEDGRDFKRAIDFLMVNHEGLKKEGSKEPILNLLHE